jgi:hypothetical protein
MRVRPKVHGRVVKRDHADLTHIREGDLTCIPVERVQPVRENSAVGWVRASN